YLFIMSTVTTSIEEQQQQQQQEEEHTNTTVVVDNNSTSKKRKSIDDDDGETTTTSTTSTSSTTSTTSNNTTTTTTDDNTSRLSKRQRKRMLKTENRRATNRAKRDAKNKQVEEEGNISKETLDETVYRIENGLRIVEPYYFTFKVWSKERWYGRQLLEMFTQEFSQLPATIYRRKIKAGWIKVNGQQVGEDYRLTNKDEIEHRVHRHEPPVSGATIKIVAQDDDVVVVDKPSSIPIHPCGRFRHNTLIYILAKEYGFQHLYGVHRLDRLTSGLLILARSPAAAKRKSEEILKGDVQKSYVALVNGRFPADKEVVVDQPLKVQNHRLGLNMVAPDGKPSKTIFSLLSYNEQTNTSVVSCLPKTGRTHQIRLHLQWLGFPIANDPLYNASFSQNAGKILTSDGVEGLGGGGFDDDDNDDNADNNNNNNNVQQHLSNNDKGLNEEIVDMDTPIECLDCKIDWGDPSTYTFGIYLHAYQYSGKGWSYQTDLPAWASQHTTDTPDTKMSTDTTTTSTSSSNSSDNTTSMNV
ncbi:hypothetical protein SAMD00019534_019280, partial [Acytostelium subglobosum LB1]|uniref:hypothetical protein n=1 Tax=Acytostelium subglobosum LB1 TaxID=1410327 RepID=UPI000644C0D3